MTWILLIQPHTLKWQKHLPLLPPLFFSFMDEEKGGCPKSSAFSHMCTKIIRTINITTTSRHSTVGLDSKVHTLHNFLEIGINQGWEKLNFLAGGGIGYFILMQKKRKKKKERFTRTKPPWFRSNCRHMYSNTSVSGHWTLCSIISTCL